MTDETTPMGRPPTALSWLLAAFVAVPTTVLLHEFAHFVAARALGFRNPALHALFVDYAADAYPNSHRVVFLAAGLATTALLTLTAAYAAFRRPGPWPAAVAVAAPIRALIWIPIALVAAQGKVGEIGGDEAMLARLTGIPVRVLVGLSMLLVWIGLWAAAHAVRHQKRDRAKNAVGLIGGLILGACLYALAAPRLLP